MAEYIDRDAVKNAFTLKKDDLILFYGQIFINFDIVQKAVENTPTADVVEVVRCKDCKHHHWEQEPCHGKTEHFCSVLNAQVFKDFYCYHGAKMDGKGEN